MATCRIVVVAYNPKHIHGCVGAMSRYSLWLCQNSYWTWPLIVDLCWFTHMKNVVDFPVRYVFTFVHRTGYTWVISWHTKRCCAASRNSSSAMAKSWHRRWSVEGVTRLNISETENHGWLVVSTPLNNISQIGSSSQLLGEIKNVPNHQPDGVFVIGYHKTLQ